MSRVCQAFRTGAIVALALAGGLADAADKLPLKLVDPASGEVVSVDAGPAALHLVFFATWCPPCRAELEQLADLEATWGEQDYELVVVAVQARHDRERLQRFARESSPPGRLLFDSGGEAQKAWQATHLPTHVVLDRTGQEVARSGALDATIEAAVERLVSLRKRAPGRTP